MNTAIGTDEMLHIFKTKWRLFLSCTILGLVGAYLISSFLMTPRYMSETRLLVNRSYTQEQVMDLGDIETNIQLINTYRDIIEDPVILNQVRENLNSTKSIDELRDDIQVVIQEDSQIFVIRGTDTVPEKAASLTNTVAEVFQENVGVIMNVENVAILSSAEPNNDPVSPRLLLNLIIGGATGLIVGTLIAVGMFLLDTKVHDEETVMRELGWINLGAVSEMRKKDLLLPRTLTADEQLNITRTTNLLEKEVSRIP